MDCLIESVGLRYCGEDEPQSGLYINDLEGMSAELIHKIADQEQINYKGVWESVKSRGIKRFKEIVSREFNGKKNWNKIIWQSDKHHLKTPLSFFLTSNDWVGIYVRVPDSKYMSIFLKSIRLYSNAEIVGGVDFNVWDLADASVLYESSIDPVKQGFSTVEINKKITSNYQYPEFFIGIDNSSLSLAATTQKAFYPNEECLCSSVGNHGEHGIYITGAKTDQGNPVIKSNLEFDNKGFGLSADINIECSFESYVCENKDLFYYPFWYLLGAEMLNEKLASNRTNFFAQGNKEMTEKKKNYFYQEFIKSIKQTIDDIPPNAICIDCDDKNTISTQSLMP